MLACTVLIPNRAGKAPGRPGICYFWPTLPHAKESEASSWLWNIPCGCISHSLQSSEDMIDFLLTGSNPVLQHKLPGIYSTHRHTPILPFNGEDTSLVYEFGCNTLFSWLYSLKVLCIQHLLSKLHKNAIICSQKEKRHRIGGEDLTTAPDWQESEVLVISSMCM